MSDILISLVILIVLEIILGVDNLVFIAVLSNRLPKHQQKRARRLGLLLAWTTRLILLAMVAWIIKLKEPLFTLFGQPFSWRDILLIGGGLFLLFKGTREIHLEFETHDHRIAPPKTPSWMAVVIQIGILDIIFSLDSVMTAVGLTEHFWVMAVAITIAIIVMVVASEPLSNFIEKHPAFRMLAFSFLLLIGMVLVAEGLSYHVPRGYLYFAVSFSLMVEILNAWATKRRSRRLSKH